MPTPLTAVHSTPPSPPPPRTAPILPPLTAKFLQPSNACPNTLRRLQESAQTAHKPKPPPPPPPSPPTPPPRTAPTHGPTASTHYCTQTPSAPTAYTPAPHGPYCLHSLPVHRKFFQDLIACPNPLRPHRRTAPILPPLTAVERAHPTASTHRPRPHHPHRPARPLLPPLAAVDGNAQTPPPAPLLPPLIAVDRKFLRPPPPPPPSLLHIDRSYASNA